MTGPRCSERVRRLDREALKETARKAGVQVAPLRRAQRGLAGLTAHERDDLLREPLHLLVLRTELQQQQLHSRALEFDDALRDPVGRPHEPRLEPALRYRVALEADALPALRVRVPVLT